METNSESNQLIIDLNKNMTKKERLKLCEDIDHTIDCDKQKEKQLLQLIDKTIEEIENKQIIYPKDNQNNEEFDETDHYFESETKIIFDENEFKLRENLSQMSNAFPESEHYFALIKGLNDRHIELDLQLKVLTKELAFYENKKKTIDDKYEETLVEDKVYNWCRICRKRAVEPYFCCREGYYCSYTHFKADKTHFKCCKRFENVKPDPYGYRRFNPTLNF